ncbi:hypothetical protein GPA10_22380 [Streptomyces sp. p1417]|uniref:Uncharacterized protein n=1 Tax=Streptomyces typhae TaxID=2681492 RepID=A0A6L6X0X9_9ACTN|nr:hypothetical protein [Streptomyces typhae]MVO87433.1 hypothetical protein [Streptomyces typhae]
MTDFISKNSVRAHSLLSAILISVPIIWPDVPWEALAASAAALLSTGVAAAKHEDAKTEAALATPPKAPN